jgi:hypothetical protein
MYDKNGYMDQNVEEKIKKWSKSCQKGSKNSETENSETVRRRRGGGKEICSS